MNNIWCDIIKAKNLKGCVRINAVKMFILVLFEKTKGQRVFSVGDAKLLRFHRNALAHDVDDQVTMKDLNKLCRMLRQKKYRKAIQAVIDNISTEQVSQEVVEQDLGHTLRKSF